MSIRNLGPERLMKRVALGVATLAASLTAALEPSRGWPHWHPLGDLSVSPPPEMSTPWVDPDEPAH
jgi:hypothetical protein